MLCCEGRASRLSCVLCVMRAERWGRTGAACRRKRTMQSALVYIPALARRATRRCLAQGLGRSHAMHGREHDGAGGVEVGPPGWVHSQWSRVLTCPQPAADRVLVEHQRTACALLLRRPFSTSQQGSVGDANGRPLDDRAKMKCETGAAWVIAPRGVHQQHVGELRQRSNSGLQQWALSEGEEPRLMGSSDMTCDHGVCHDPLIYSKRCSGTADLTAHVVPRRRARKADETPAYRVSARRRVPGWRSGHGQLPLLAAQLVSRGRPRCMRSHRTRIARDGRARRRAA